MAAPSGRLVAHYLYKYYLFDASGGSTGMDDVYGNRVSNFHRLLDQHLERGLWLRVHYHSIGPKEGASEENFRAALGCAQAHAAEVWIAGMADIHKYQSERAASRLTLMRSSAARLEFRLEVHTDHALYDHPLTLEVTGLPAGRRATLECTAGPDAAGVLGAEEGVGPVLRFELPPRTGGCALVLGL